MSGVYRHTPDVIYQRAWMRLAPLLLREGVTFLTETGTPETLALLAALHPEVPGKTRLHLRSIARLTPDPLTMARRLSEVADDLPHGAEKALRIVIEAIEEAEGVE